MGGPCARKKKALLARARFSLPPHSQATSRPGARISAPYSVAPADEHGDVFVHGLEHIYEVLQEHL